MISSSWILFLITSSSRRLFEWFLHQGDILIVSSSRRLLNNFFIKKTFRRFLHHGDFWNGYFDFLFLSPWWRNNLLFSMKRFRTHLDEEINIWENNFSPWWRNHLQSLHDEEMSQHLPWWSFGLLFSIHLGLSLVGFVLSFLLLHSFFCCQNLQFQIAMQIQETSTK